jgi:kynurenine formamidase
MSKIVDLTYPLKSDMLVWPGNPRPVYEWIERANTGSANVTYLRMCAHTGTHVDAPLHFIDGGDSLDKVSLDRFWGKARMFTVEDSMEGWEIPRSAVEGSGFSLGDATIFILRTKIERYAEVRQYNLEYAYPSIDLLGWLLSQGMTCYMTDATSIDPYSDKESLRHHCVLERGCPVVENLRNLALLPTDKAKSFVVSAMPLALPGREGSPCRAAAWLED